MISAIQRSLNLAAAHAMVELTTPADVAAFARRCGINSELREYPSLALGTSEVSPLEMAAATAVFPAYGLRARPYSVARIDDKYGRLIYAARPDTATVLDSATAFLLTTALQTVVDSGTARVVRGAYAGAAAGKTGTTQRSTDAWFVGYTPRLCTAVWIGFDDPSNVLTGAYRYGGAACAPIWGKAMAEISRNGANLVDTAFAAPSTVTFIDLCTSTGQLAVEDCPGVIYTPVNALKPPAECKEHGGGFFGW
jgi:penicillin-binding protein 1A